jgi:hypothetical protein
VLKTLYPGEHVLVETMKSPSRWAGSDGRRRHLVNHTLPALDARIAAWMCLRQSSKRNK